MNRIFVIRVGADSSNYLIRSPILADNRFEFVPIPEGEKWEQRPIPPKHPMLRYRDIPCFNNAARNLGEYVGKQVQTLAHNDPEFAGMTYGDVCELYPRARNLIDGDNGRTGVRQGDYLFFLARLVKHDGTHFADDAALYFIGYFHIENVLGPIQLPPDDVEEARIGTNAHVLRAQAENSWGDERRKFWVFKGGPDSVRFRFALETNWEWLSTVFHDAYGCLWREKRGHTRMQRVASYTRTIRCQLDPDNPKQNDSYQRFWDKVNRHLNRHA